MAKAMFVKATTLAAMAALFSAPLAKAAPCLMVTLTGTGGPPPYNGLAGPGTLVRYGDDTDNCSSVTLQFDAGRGTLIRYSQIGVPVTQLNAIFFTHMHSDHTSGFSDIVQTRWLYSPPGGPKLDVVCSTDARSPQGFVVSCSRFVAHINDPYREAGETAQRLAETGGSIGAAPEQGLHLITFEPHDDARVVWSAGDVKVSAIRSTHIPGHASFRVDTPAGSVVISGDAASDVPEPPRNTSTSDQVEKLAKGADIIVHAAVHPVLAPDKGSGIPPHTYYRQSNVTDIGAMAQRAGAKYLMLTHLGPALGAVSQGDWKVVGGPLSEADFRRAAQDGGFSGEVIVGTDLTSVRLPAK